jgi:hypothetical protein
VQALGLYITNLGGMISGFLVINVVDVPDFNS